MARYHVNRLGRFSSPDPLSGSLANPQSLNHYVYAGNDPINLVDPTGLEACDPSVLGPEQQLPPICTEAVEEDSGSFNCTLDGISTYCGQFNSQDQVQCPNNVCSYYNYAYGEYVNFQVTTNGNGAYFPSLGPGWDFSTEEEALAAGAIWAAAATADNGIENCGMTYSSGGGGFSFTGSVERHLASCQPLNASSLVPSDATADGGYHSHPNDPNYLHERFSGQPGDYRGLGGDVGWAVANGYPISLGTPEGRVIIYYPGANCQVFIIGGPFGTGTTISTCQ